MANIDAPPPFARSLAPYIKPREEAVRIRRALTLYLKAQVILSDDASASHISLCGPHGDVGAVKRIPLELNNGLRAQYLKALQANLVARREYNEVVQQITDQKKDINHSNDENDDANKDKVQVLQTYLSLLQSRREHGKLQIFQHYLGELNAMDAAKSGYLAITEDRSQLYGPILGVFPHEQIPGNGAPTGPASDVEDLIYELEKAVIRAKRKADAEKRLVEKLKSQSQRGRGDGDGDVPLHVKLTAMRRTRDELVRWVEETLVTSTDDGEAIEEEADSTADEDAARSMEDLRLQIQEHYASYINARTALLHALSAASRPLPSESRNNPGRTQTPPTVQHNAATGISLLFPYISNSLLPLSKAHKAPAGQKSYLSTILVKEKEKACQILDRLQDESHLLPEYPMLAKDPRFKRAVAAINPRQLLSAPALQNTATSEIVTRAEAWAFAAQEAGVATKAEIEENLSHGDEMTKNAGETLQEIYEIMNQDYDEATRVDDEGEKEEGKDIWASDANKARNRVRYSRTEKQPKGPWSGLNGKVGVVGDG
ncbi:hypothetical protein AJ80_04458 [Polytolypa hystricis UAMH7299]|uniref:Uncharacterized protein n=1 Tax=Polytolypa hystricis (strain UAMH7299) TaxID=1447883 RepID=A0A2B7YC58_POLH7|nr:hypothetical protein AJ80_04458 [Polytolypa hystricis UAMH7299]